MEHTGAIGVGQLLIATQPGRGGFFDGAVVLLIEHRSEGTVGLCLNLVSTAVSDEVRAEIEQFNTAPGRVMDGGPVNLDVVVALGEPANPEAPPPGWDRVIGDIGVVDINFPRELLETSFSQLRVFVGLSCWAPGQLEGELIRGSWFRTTARTEDVFADPEGLWRQVLRRIGGATGRWSTWTEDPELN